MSDLIRIVDLEVVAHIGVPEEERRAAQRLLVSVELSVGSFSSAARSDELARTINYFNVAQGIKALAAKRPRKLLETLADELATDLLKNYPIRKVALEIKKFVLPDAQYVSVKIERSSGT